MKRFRVPPKFSDGSPNKWASLDQWMADLVMKWEPTLPREVGLRIEPTMLHLKAAELRVPFSLREVNDRYAPFMTPLRDSVDPRLTAEEQKIVDDHIRRHP